MKTSWIRSFAGRLPKGKIEWAHRTGGLRICMRSRHIFLSAWNSSDSGVQENWSSNRGIACVWMPCQPREASNGFVLAFAARSEILVPQMA